MLEALAWVALAVVLAVIAGYVIGQVLGPDGPGLLVMRVVAYASIAGTLLYFLVLPLVRRTSDQRFALYVEERAPELRQALLSAVHELHAPESERSSPSLAARLISRTVTAVRPLEADGRIERPRMVRAQRTLGGVVVAAALLALLGPDGLRDTARALFVPWSVAEAATPVMAVRVVPGNADVPKGASVDVGASLSGFACRQRRAGVPLGFHLAVESTVDGAGQGQGALHVAPVRRRQADRVLRGVERRALADVPAHRVEPARGEQARARHAVPGLYGNAGRAHHGWRRCRRDRRHDGDRAADDHDAGA